MGISYKVGNDAERGGLTGEFIKIDRRSAKKIMEIFSNEKSN